MCLVGSVYVCKMVCVCGRVEGEFVAKKKHAADL